jgi:hypothetical protein
MQIPHWVDKGKRSKAEKATARLKYIIGILAAQHTARGSMRSLGEHCGLDHSTIAIYVRRGAFSASAAGVIVGKLRDPDLHTWHLTRPLDIERAAQSG